MLPTQAIAPKKRRLVVSLLTSALLLTAFALPWLRQATSTGAQANSCLSGNITKTNVVAVFYSTNTVAYGVPISVGSVIVACDPDGVKAGVFTVTTAGEYGSMYVYGDDATTPGADEGASPGDTITFYINGELATPRGPDDPIWEDKALLHVDLLLGSYSHLYLPLVTRDY